MLVEAGKSYSLLKSIASLKVMFLYASVLLLCPPILTFMPLFLTLKVLAPMVEKFSFRKYFMESMAVRMPTRAIMPKPMIAMVRMVRRR
jgi:membrane protease YdiL (CAAX protease family)